MVIKKDFKKLGNYTLNCLYFRSKDAAAFLITICSWQLKSGLEKKRIRKYKMVCSISGSPILAAVKNGVKKIQAVAYNGARTVFRIPYFLFICLDLPRRKKISIMLVTK